MTTVALGGGAEFDRIREIAASLGVAAGDLGDDTAVVPAGEGTLVVSTDMSVENEHFRREWLSVEEMGWRATASALSDLAASAAGPVAITVAVGVPANAGKTDLVDLMHGAGECAIAHGVKVIGGDISRAPVWTISVTVLGYAKRLMSRSGAVPGDNIWVTGTLGGARAALVAWQQGGTPVPSAHVAFVYPSPRIVVAEWLANQGATAMLDISDGLGGDAQHLAAASDCKVEIDVSLLPVHEAVESVASHIKEAPALFAAIGGEDYELLFTMPADWGGAAECRAVTGVLIAAIGRVSEGSGVEFRLDGKLVEVSTFRHCV